jgi:hypothetical protein
MKITYRAGTLLTALALIIGGCSPAPAASSSPNVQIPASSPAPGATPPVTTAAPAVSAPLPSPEPAAATPVNTPAPAEPASAVPNNSPPSPAPAPVTATGPAAFSLSNLSIYPKQPAPRGYVMVSVDVMNTGVVEGTCTLDVKVDGVTMVTENVTLAGGATQTVKTGFAAGKMGTYTLSVGDLSMEMVVFMQM